MCTNVNKVKYCTDGRQQDGKEEYRKVDVAGFEEECGLWELAKRVWKAKKTDKRVIIMLSKADV